MAHNPEAVRFKSHPRNQSTLENMRFSRVFAFLELRENISVPLPILFTHIQQILSMYYIKAAGKQVKNWPL